jgi:hypothetical protein
MVYMDCFFTFETSPPSYLECGFFVILIATKRPGPLKGGGIGRVLGIPPQCIKTSPIYCYCQHPNYDYHGKSHYDDRLAAFYIVIPVHFDEPSILFKSFVSYF